MNYEELINKNAITDNTKELINNKIFLKTAQNEKYSQNISSFLTPKDLLNNIKTKFIGITGTNGKTTTAFVLGFLLNQAGFNVAVQGTEGFFVNGEKREDKTLTTPSIFTTIKRVYKYKPDFFIMEVSSHAIAQNRIEGIDFTAKILTSFSQDHLDYHKSMKEYKKIKEGFFQDETLKIVNGQWKMDNGRFSIITVSGYDFKINSKNLYVLEKSIVNDIPMAGEFNKMNFSLALKTAENLTSLSLNNFLFDNFKGVPGRMEIVSINPLIIIDFAHTPDGMQKVISSLKGKKLVVFGAGGDRDKGKRVKMGEVADKLADYIILTNDNPRCEKPEDIVSDIKSGIKKTPFEIILDRKEAIKRAVELSKNFDATLILGKGDEKYIEQCREKIPFSDRETVKNFLI
ncbi:UDP-N-acetylmuramoyl-L-alanyl-D-glutamate--2,6-diaminopimelate ligase [Lebetimonas natsushimae]|uniref:UDP-N-acetylmuramoyl-L-alanyl-D-glutamate--2,6-diaminopimelate ligase n=1 Tax=Lebetimonas natsushimae TaxID=1936991 RepID=A0A292YBC2_9BACT|nr:UDP-N-acetylmuramoyl-L-alanyl-D-glutamate--2,6-diaminopimelate ligase [Lebetimonas natsushimae]GAX86836.1 UDP-N-acetylmuramoyl-L-alanyl-D-glutamate--2,6-diaminopimelate ligase [Lebetimonas natsushimae]